MNIKQKGEELYEKLYDTVRCYSAQNKRIKQFTKLTNPDALSAEQEAQVKAFYAPYKTPNLVFHRYFTQKTGEFCVNYIPQDLYVGYIDPHFNDIRAAKYLDNKCYFDALFHDIPQPHIVLKRVNNMWFNNGGEVVSESQVTQIIHNEESGVFVKEAQTSAGGKGVTYVQKSDDAAQKVFEAARAISTDIVIQRGLVQHEKLAAVNSSSVNTLRLYSILHTDGSVKIYSAVLRMGVGTSKVDNYSSGGVCCGITNEGKLRKYAYDKKGDRVEKHPTSGIVFDGFVIPSYDQAVKLVHKAHPMMPHFRSVSWDIAIIEDGTPVLIEANLCRGGIDLLQLSNGPLFGEDTVKILDEVFKNR